MATELVELVQTLEMGEFYAKRVLELAGPLRRAFIMSLDGGHDSNYELQVNRANRDYREKLIANRESVRALLVEQLRYQRWANEA